MIEAGGYNFELHRAHTEYSALTKKKAFFEPLGYEKDGHTPFVNGLK